MYNSKLFSLLEHLKRNKSEIGVFERFVQSPYFNRKKEVVELLAYIRQYWHAKETVREKKMTKELIFAYLFPKEKKYVDWKMNQCISNLIQLLLKFLAIQEIDTNTERKLRIKAFKERGMDNQFFKECCNLEEETLEEMKSKPFTALATQEQLMDTFELLYFHHNKNFLSSKEQQHRLKRATQTLEENYILRKLIRYCEMLTELNIGTETKFDIPKASTIYAKAGPLIEKNLLTKAYYLLVELYQEQNYELVAPLEKIILQLFKAEGEHNKLQLFELFVTGLPSFPEQWARIKYIFQFYSNAIENKILLEGNFIAPIHAINSIHIGHVLKKKEWVTNFIETNQQYFANRQDKGENVICLFKAYSSYYQQEYNEAYRLLDLLKFENASYGIRQYYLLLMTLIEGRDEIYFKYDFETKCKSFRAFLNRKLKENLISEAKKRDNLIFIRICFTIYYAAHRKVNKEKLLEEVHANGEIPFKYWLEGKIRAL